MVMLQSTRDTGQSHIKSTAITAKARSERFCANCQLGIQAMGQTGERNEQQYFGELGQIKITC